MRKRRSLQEFKGNKELARREREMLAQPTTDNVVCFGCGADVRADAAFCYSCGASVVAAQLAAEEGQIEQVPDKDFVLDAGNMPAERVEAGIEHGESTKNASRRPLTAAMLRRKKAFNRRPVEMEWTPPEHDSSFFFITAMGLVLFAALILGFALYLH